MFIVKENTCRLDTQLDRLQQVIERLRAEDPTLNTNENTDRHRSLSLQMAALENIVRTLSIRSETQDLIQPSRLVDLISDIYHRFPVPRETALDISTTHGSDLIWLATAKATVQTLGWVLSQLVEQTHILGDEIRYWDEILASPWYTGVYAVQTGPLRIWHRTRYPSFYGINSVSSRWTQFYDLFRLTLHTQSMFAVRTRISSLFASCRPEIRQKQKKLEEVKDIHANSIGILMKECLSFQVDGDDFYSTEHDHKALGDQWRNTVLRGITLIEGILCNTTGESASTGFEQRVFAMAHAEERSVQNQLDGLISVFPTKRLVRILSDLLPAHKASSKSVVQHYGHPSRLVRYWLPVSSLLLSASMSIQIVANKRTEIIEWLVNLGSTAVDFWGNWIVEPIRKLIGTIRHDKGSEIAIMSKNSLEADRASLERMVVDFVHDHRALIEGEDTLVITSNVKEGDLTPVLKAYERDLRSPFVGTMRGDLVRALLIQIQKTKVDVEIAMSGIDSLLKSQELVFGFVGLTPGILVSYSVLQWISSLFGNRKGLRRSREGNQLRHALRNVDRTLALSSPTTSGILTYRDHGLLICDAEFLLQRARVVLKGADLRKFSEDIGDLVNVQRGTDRQLQVVRRIGWTYSQWFQ